MEGIIAALIKIVGKERLLVGDDLKERYHHIWHMEKPLLAKAMVLPKTTEEVAAIMRICYEANQPVIAYGGLTNLVGSTETKGDEVLLSLEKLNQIEEIDPQSRTMTVQSGVILENIQQAAKDNDLLFPLNFGAKGTAQIGGAISTNAGGLRVFRFGMTRQLILGLEAVLADGTVISSMKKIIKDNSGYDLKQLFIGSEGTLGIVTKAVLKLVETPKSRNSAFVGLEDYDQVVDFLKYMDSGLAGTLSGFELFWRDTYRVMTRPPASVRPPLPSDYNYYVLLESLGGNPEQDKLRLQDLLESALENGLILDAALADNASDLAWFWQVREDVHVMVSQCNNDQHFDISLPIPLIGEVVNRMRVDLSKMAEVENFFTFGHVADGNIHFIVGKSNDSPELIRRVNEVIYAPLKGIGGSVSAEHGIGLHKKHYLNISRTEAEINLMRLLKRTMDSKGILNPRKIVSI
ncbi:MAG: FAD-binding oxidoreductase [Bacteroidota bacterium]